MTAMLVKVPDIGDFKDIPIIEIFVKPGDVVKAEDSLVTLESDKATMDVPAPAGGTVREVRVKLGDKVSEGSVVLVLEAAGAAAAPAAPVSEPKQAQPVVAGSPAATDPCRCISPKMARRFTIRRKRTVRWMTRCGGAICATICGRR